jgi:NADH-quinone oxidoreductase subunit L
MPWTYWSMLAATLAIAGAPLTSGFFSKDGILYAAFTHVLRDPLQVANEKAIAAGGHAFEITKKMSFFNVPTWYGPTLFVLGVLGAVMTAFYMFRLFFRTFHGPFAGWQVDPSKALATNPFANELALVDDSLDHGTHDPHDTHGEPHDDAGHQAPQEAPWTMALPVAILGAGSLLVGFLYAEPLHLDSLGHFLNAVWCNFDGTAVYGAHGTQNGAIQLIAGAESLEWPLMIPGITAFVVGLWLAHWAYVQRAGKPTESLRARFSGLYDLLYKKWYVDEIYEATIVAGVNGLALGARYFDAWIVDGIFAKLTSFVAMVAGEILRFFQTGRVAFYGALMAIGVAVIGGFFAFPRFDVQMLREDEDTFVITASPGLGYAYKFAVDDDKEKSFTPSPTRTVQLDRNAQKLLRVDVTNLWGWSSSKEFTLTNETPQTTASAAPSASAPRGH